jgi:hypothetical protein
LHKDKQLALVYYCRAKEKRLKKIAEGKCAVISCNDLRVNNCYCDKHRLIYNERMKAKRLKRADNGVCEICNEPVKNGYDFCIKHQDRRDELRRIRSSKKKRKENDF